MDDPKTATQTTFLTSPTFNAVEADRTLASIVKVTNVEPVPGADRIDVAQVLGWELVVKKAEFKVGDLAIYFGIGGILDKDNSNTNFLEGKPLRTKKIRGIVSQGLLGSLAWLKDYGVDPATVKEGDDVTKIMKVQKWVPLDELEVYASNSDNERGPFPSFIPKTDEERIQNMSRQLTKFVNVNVVLMQKFDGTSCTYVYCEGKFYICSRNNVLLKETEMAKPYMEISRRYKLDETMPKLKRNLAIQGEIIGPKLSANRHKVADIEYHVFNIYDIDTKTYLGHDDIVVISEILGLKMIKVVYRGPVKSEWLTTEEPNKLNARVLLDMANTEKYDTGQMAEGFVLKLDNKMGPKLSCKIISNNYLLKYGL